MTTVVLAGSYNGQDSLGDECLLKATVEQVYFHSPRAEIVIHLHGADTPFSRSYAASADIRMTRGLQSALWRAESLTQRLRIPLVFQPAVSRLLLLHLGYEAVRDLKSADAFFIFGGTQFAGQWYSLNAPAYLRSARIVQESGGKVFFGPQQYGPLSEISAAELRLTLVQVASDWRTRNRRDAELLEPDAARRESRVVYDEVFSNTRLYPTRSSNKRHRHILFNLRLTTFDTDAPMASEQFAAITIMMDSLSRTFDLPVVFFAVSDATFCDDNATLAAIRKFSAAPDRYSSIGRVRDEHHLMDLAQDAAVVVSMSFHGCILSGIGGTPFVPIQEGQYYDYKYVDFDKYSGDQSVPLIALAHCDPAGDTKRITDYVGRFRLSRMQEARELACKLVDEFYAHAFEELS